MNKNDECEVYLWCNRHCIIIHPWTPERFSERQRDHEEHYRGGGGGERERERSGGGDVSPDLDQVVVRQVGGNGCDNGGKEDDK